MKPIVVGLLVLVAGAALAQPVGPDITGIVHPIGRPTVSFAADFTIDTGGMLTKGRMTSIPMRDRYELHLGPISIVNIFYADLGVGYSLNLDRKTYSEFRAAQGLEMPNDPAAAKWTLIPDGEDNADGYVRTRYRAEEMKSNGDGFRGTLWVVDAYNLVVQAQGANMRGGKAMPLQYRVFNIKIGPQDPALFQPPADFTRFGTGVDPVVLPSVPPPRAQP